MPKKLLVRNIHQLAYITLLIVRSLVGNYVVSRAAVRYNKLGFILHSAIHHHHHHVACPCRSVAVSTISRHSSRLHAVCRADHRPRF